MKTELIKSGYKMYSLNYNYSISYTVFIKNNDIFIFDKLELKVHLTAEQIFLFSNTNTLLLQLNLEKLEYMHISNKIFTFNAYYPIIKYVSLMGNNNVSYPYAIDCENNYYLFSADVVFKINLLENLNPYDYYWDSKSLITCDMGFNPPKEPYIKQFENIIKFYIDEQQYTLTYTPDPSKEFDRLTQNVGNNLYVEKNDGSKNILLKEDYCNLINEFGNINGFRKILNILFYD
jgi:hypothetical protein